MSGGSACCFHVRHHLSAGGSLDTSPLPLPGHPYIKQPLANNADPPFPPNCPPPRAPSLFSLCRHGDALGALGGKLDAKWLNTEGRTKLRNVWDRTR